MKPVDPSADRRRGSDDRSDQTLYEIEAPRASCQIRDDKDRDHSNGGCTYSIQQLA